MIPCPSCNRLIPDGVAQCPLCGRAVGAGASAGGGAATGTAPEIGPGSIPDLLESSTGSQHGATANAADGGADAGQVKGLGGGQGGDNTDSRPMPYGIGSRPSGTRLPVDPDSEPLSMPASEAPTHPSSAMAVPKVPVIGQTVGAAMGGGTGAKSAHPLGPMASPMGTGSKAPGSNPPGSKVPASKLPSAPGSKPPPAPQFAPGTMIGTRYRVEALIGRGGMGEVYRANDLTLGQDVALKFLPEKYLADPTHAQHLLHEVKIARKVSHPNVCRVHDIEQFDGQYFISMELVEGEDLGTIIRRVGRLSGERAISIARQICIGLAAAHAQGVLHRDLKPGNVLIDGAGNAHIADFGLSALSTDSAEVRHRGGTPAYMPPEQLLGSGVGPSGDVYCLGLVLYEMFTGKPVFRPKDIPELLDMHQKGVPPPSSVERSIDPAVENVIIRCLEHRPEDRPASPLVVAAELPGGSLVAAALDAGATLSPELVAAAGTCRVTGRAMAVALFAGVLVCLAVIVGLARRVDLTAMVPLEKSADVLADRSRTILKELGYTISNGHEAFAFDYYEQLLSEIAAKDPSPNWWEQLAWPRPSPIDFWYRRHSRPLVTDSVSKQVSWLDPAPAIPGMVSLRLDPGGRLRELTVVTAGIESLPEELTDPSLAALRKANQEPNPLVLMEAAELDPDLFTPVPATWVNPVYCDEVLCYAGVYPDNAGQPITVNMGFFRGWPVSFRIIETKLESASQFKDIGSDWHRQAGNSIQLMLAVVTTIGAAFLARRNIRLERGDRNGAFRLAIAAFVLTFASFLLRASHHDEFQAEASVLMNAVMFAVFNATMFWIFYLAIEPHARRLWPESLFAWSRLMKDRWTDPMIGQSILVGIFVGLIALILTQTHALSPMWMGWQPDAPIGKPEFLAETLEGGRKGVGVVLYFIINAMRFALLYITGIVLIINLTKRRDLSIMIYATLHALGWTLVVYNSWMSWGFGIMIGVLAGGVLRQYGLLALAVGVGTCRMLLAFPLELQPSTWYFGSSLMALGLVACLAAFGAAAASGMLARKSA